MCGNRRRNGRGAGGPFGFAAALLALGLGVAADKPPGDKRPSQPAASPRPVEDAPLPTPPQPPPGPASGPVAAGVPAAGLRTSPDGACTQTDASAKAAHLVQMLQTLIARDPERARGLLDEFQQAVQRLAQHSANLAETCRSYDALIAHAGE